MSRREEARALWHNIETGAYGSVGLDDCGRLLDNYTELRLLRGATREEVAAALAPHWARLKAVRKALWRALKEWEEGRRSEPPLYPPLMFSDVLEELEEMLRDEQQRQS